MSKNKATKPAGKIQTPPAKNNQTETSATQPWALILGLSVLIAVMTWLSYSGARDNNFVNWDDPTYVSENPLFTPLTPANAERVTEVIISNNFHPITMWSLMKNVQASGLKAGPIIQANILIHIFGSLFVFMFIGMLSRGKWLVAGTVALIFAVHPMHVESVAWVSERKDVLYVMFGMASMVTWLLYSRNSNWGWYALTLGLFTLACLSKAMAVIFPLLYLLADYWDDKDIKSPKIWLDKIPFFALSLLFGLIAMNVQKGGNFHGWFDNIEIKNAVTSANQLGLFDKIQFAGYGLGQYMLGFFAPLDLVTFHPYPPGLKADAWPYVIGFVVLAAYIAATIWAFLKCRKGLAFGLAWGFFSLMLVLQFIAVGSAIMADRYTYLPFVGWAFALCIALFQWAWESKKWMVFAVLFLINAGFAWLTARQVETWQDSIVLWSKVIERYPNDGSAYTKRGTSWGKERNDLKAARADFEKAIALNPGEAQGYEGLGIIAGMQNDHKTALEMFTKCIEISPDYFNYYFNRGLAYLQNQQPDRA
ncbi:MAG: tetratricopeptide repeat protein, partial [Saprospiraceae bacterium]|nr:tetratricopeptide repeat protein [Saprospiraceae bacterium]